MLPISGNIFYGRDQLSFASFFVVNKLGNIFYFHLNELAAATGMRILKLMKTKTKTKKNLVIFTTALKR